MVIAMLTRKPPVLAAGALLLLFPDVALAQTRSSAGGAPASLAAPSPRLSAPTTTLRTAPSVSSGTTTPAAPSPSGGLTPLSPTPSAGLTPPAGVPATTTPTTAQPGSTVAPLSPMSDPLPNQFATEQGGGAAPNLDPGTSSAPSKPGGGGKGLADCMGFWDAATHMSKGEWRAACKRSMKEFPDIKW
jgi:hypothetical protein